ncbi:hypothetical protein AB1Y20_023329 [Prymnesium parvum]|uniref:tRNA(Phe) (4-demethylwyosine(37)-C(7)) aminocarboxypropyltransferase n=1 Tax=Prymnesium parvum TaxID=97485 RepID=A0AB34JFX1_PRYPA
MLGLLAATPPLRVSSSPRGLLCSPSCRSLTTPSPRPPASRWTPPLLSLAPHASPLPAPPPLLAHAEDFFRRRGVRLHAAPPARPGSRTTSRIAVRASPHGGAALLGLFAPGTHQVVPCAADERCHAPHHPAINAAIGVLARELDAFAALSAYDERRGDGTLRYVQLSVERRTARVQLTLVANAAAADDDPALPRFAARLWRRHAAALHSVWLNFNPSRGNNILSYAPAAWQLAHAHADGVVAGGSLLERFPSGASFVLPPFVFRQGNLDDFDRVVAQVCAAVPRGARVCEWYAGVGVLGLSLARRAEWVRCSDINPPYEAFHASRELLPPRCRGRVSYAVGAAADRLADAVGADVAVVDPPRKGLDAELRDALCDRSEGAPCAGLHTLVYVSCGFPALMSDVDALLAAGWRIRGQKAMAHILFVGANHIETVVVFERSLNPSRGGDGARPAVASAMRQGKERGLSREPTRREAKQPVLARVDAKSTSKTTKRPRRHRESPRKTPR